MLKLRIVSLLAVFAAANGCARGEMPVLRYMVQVSPGSLAACMFRQAQASARQLEAVGKTELDDPKEWQVTKRFESSLVWEADISAVDAGHSALTTRHFPSFVSWDEDMMKSVRPCLSGYLLERT